MKLKRLDLVTHSTSIPVFYFPRWRSGSSFVQFSLSVCPSVWVTCVLYMHTESYVKLEKNLIKLFLTFFKHFLNLRITFRLERQFKNKSHIFSRAFFKPLRQAAKNKMAECPSSFSDFLRISQVFESSFYYLLCFNLVSSRG